MTDTKMKPLGELAKELRAGTATYCQCPGCQIPATAADRLERIEKAFDGFLATEGVSWKLSPTGSISFGELRRAIEGEP